MHLIILLVTLAISLIILMVLIKITLANNGIRRLVFSGQQPLGEKAIKLINNELSIAGFDLQEQFDFDSVFDEFYTLKFDVYTLKIQQNVELEVAHTYTATTQDVWCYSRSSCLLVIEGTSFEMPGATVQDLLRLKAIFLRSFTKKSENL